MKTKAYQGPISMSNVHVKWSCPPEGMSKFNVDGSVVHGGRSVLFVTLMGIGFMGLFIISGLLLSSLLSFLRSWMRFVSLLIWVSPV